VRGVRDEAPLGLERFLERAEHRVERRTEPGQLAPPAFRHALARLAGLGDPLGCRGETPHRRERRIRDDPAGRGGDADPAQRDEDQDQAQPFECMTRLLQALHDEHGPVDAEEAVERRHELPHGDRRLPGLVQRDVAEEAIPLPARNLSHGFVDRHRVAQRYVGARAVDDAHGVATEILGAVKGARVVLHRARLTP